MGKGHRDKVAVITGGANGIGQAFAKRLAEDGAHVAIADLAPGDATVRLVEQAGREALACKCDVSSPDAVAAMAKEVQGRFGRCDILINCAGIFPQQAFEEMTFADWRRLMSINLDSAFLCASAFVPGMKARRWGRIVNMSSVAAQAGSIVGVHYAASKAGMIGLTRSYARVLAKEGITVNAITPALVATEMVVSNPVAKPDMIPIGRFGDVEEVAGVALMLARNAYITGQTINVNGGYYMS